uniref:MHC class II beta chain N-terminal domain-containing protein n=1 Tax=Gopherus agassizii TaxID=38772 RepID=A0A452GPS4_9SAUR
MLLSSPPRSRSRQPKPICPPEHFLYQIKHDCYFTNGTERVRYLYRDIYNGRQDVHFDSELGVYVADTELGRPDAEGWNKDPGILADRRAAVDTFCRYNYGVAQTGKVVGRTGERGPGQERERGSEGPG